MNATQWKSYGIQLLPFTPAATVRDQPGWVEEMLPFFNESCFKSPICEAEGWSILVLLSAATIGKKHQAWAGIKALPDSVFESAGGNGQSRSNSLWWIATRPDPAPAAPEKPAKNAAGSIDVAFRRMFVTTVALTATLATAFSS